MIESSDSSPNSFTHLHLKFPPSSLGCSYSRTVPLNMPDGPSWVQKLQPGVRIILSLTVTCQVCCAVGRCTEAEGHSPHLQVLRLAGLEELTVQRVGPCGSLPKLTSASHSQQGKQTLLSNHKCFPASWSQELLQTVMNTPSLLMWSWDKLFCAT